MSNQIRVELVIDLVDDEVLDIEEPYSVEVKIDGRTYTASDIREIKEVWPHRSQGIQIGDGGSQNNYFGRS